MIIESKIPITKAQVGLGNADNTSDINKPVSIVQQTAITNAEASAEAYADSVTQQATELVRGTAKVITQTIIQTNTTTNDTDFVTAKKFWLGITKFLTLAWTWAEKQTFSKSIGVGASPSSSLTGGMASPVFKVTQLITNNAGLPALTNFTTAGGTILMFVSGTGWNTGAGTSISVDIKVNGTTVHTMNIQPSLQTASHRTLPPAYIVRTGLAAGTNNISFTLTSGNVDVNDRWNVTIMELPF